MGNRKPDSKLASLYYGDLLTYPYTSPAGNYYPGRYYNRNGKKVNRVIVHHFANGSTNMTRQTLLKVFKNRTGSVTYAVFSDGEIVQFLPESVAPWTTSSYNADITAITIEVEDITGDPSWKISDAAYRSLVKLIADICDRYDGIGKLRFDGTKTGSNLHMHKWYSSTSCPGPYLEKLITSGKLVEDVNEAVEALKMNGTIKSPQSDKVVSETFKTVNENDHGEHQTESGDRYFIESDGTQSKSKFAYVRNQDAWKYFGKDGLAKKGWWILKDRTGTPRLYFFDETGKMLKGTHELKVNFCFDLEQGFADVGVEV